MSWVEGQKKELRLQARSMRKKIGAERRTEAEDRAFQSLTEKVQLAAWVLSYASFGDEFDTWKINGWLADKGALVLPKMEQMGLKLYQVEKIDLQLQTNSWGIREPIPEKCCEVDPSKISLALIPGLAFDPFFQRLGYGQGYYDRLLPKLAFRFGLGFIEQTVAFPLPTLPTDVPLSGLFLF